MRKMEHGRRSSWSRWSPGNATTRGCVEPRFLTEAFEAASGPVLRLAAALEGTKMISIPFLHLKCAKWNTEAGADGADGAPEMESPAAAWSLLLSTDRLRLPQGLYFGWLEPRKRNHRRLPGASFP